MITWQRMGRIWPVVFGLLLASLLLDQNMLVNEADKLPLALKQVWPQWMPHDWYLAWPQSHQWLFQAVAGWPLFWFGFPLGSLINRMLGYAIWSFGFSALALRIGLRPCMAALALALYLPKQGLLAGEWMVGGAESKTWAYGLLLLGFALWTERRGLGRVGFLAGLASSFHPLVGFYGGLGLLVLEVRRQWIGRRYRWRQLAWGMTAFCGGAFALFAPLFQQRTWGEAFIGSQGVAVPSISWIYVYLRLPHHLVPSAWFPSDGESWVWPALVSFGGLIAWCWLVRGRAELLRGAGLCGDVVAHLGRWVAVGVVFFGCGLLIACFDSQGHWLRFYPFRFADAWVPLMGAVLLACVAQVILSVMRWSTFLAWLLVAVLVVLKAPAVVGGGWLHPTQVFAEKHQRAALNRSIERFTPVAGTLLTPPQGFEDLAWRLNRSPVVQFKQFPSIPVAIQQWYLRLLDLSGGVDISGPERGFDLARRLNHRYQSLSSNQLLDLARRYRVQAVVTMATQPGPLGWQQVFRDARWALWLPRLGSSSPSRLPAQRLRDAGAKPYPLPHAAPAPSGAPLPPGYRGGAGGPQAAL